MWRCRSTLRSGSISSAKRSNTLDEPTCLFFPTSIQPRVLCVIYYKKKKEGKGKASIFHIVTHIQTICQFPCDTEDAEEHVLDQVNINELRERVKKKKKRDTSAKDVFTIHQVVVVLRRRSVVDGQLLRGVGQYSIDQLLPLQKIWIFFFEEKGGHIKRYMHNNRSLDAYKNWFRILYVWCALLCFIFPPCVAH